MFIRRHGRRVGFLLLIWAGWACDSGEKPDEPPLPDVGPDTEPPDEGPPPDMGCGPGYTMALSGCVDIDECRQGNGGCHPSVVCFNTPGDRVCGACPAGTEGDGVGPRGCQAACPDGQHDDGDGRCVPEGTCGRRYEIDSDGDCVPITCPDGEHDGGEGECLPVGQCAPGFTLGTRGACVGFTCPTDDPGEPDDTPATAQAVTAGAVKHGVLCPGDADHFAFEAEPPCPALLAIEGTGVRVAAFGPADMMINLPLPVGGRIAMPIDHDGRFVVALSAPDETVYAFSVTLDGHDGGGGECAPDGECSLGYAIDGRGACTLCARGYHEAGDGTCRPEGECAATHHDGGDGSCVPLGLCTAGHHNGGDGDCLPAGQCSPGFRDGGGDVCTDGDCLAGYHEGGDGTCLPEGECADGLRNDGRGDCTDGDCAAGYQEGGDGTCTGLGTCAPGYHDGNGLGEGAPCLPVGECERGLHDGGDGSCVPVPFCAPNYFDRGDGICDTRDAACVGGRVRDTGGQCICAEGTIDGGGGACVLPGQCADGHQDNGRGVCTPLGQCTGNHHYTPWGTCRASVFCDVPLFDDGIGGCAEQCAPGFRAGGADACVAPPNCAQGFHDDGAGACVAADQCADGYRETVIGDCLADLACDGDDGDDGLANARPLPIGGRLDGILCGDERDVARIDVPAGCTVVVDLMHAAFEADLDLELFDANGDALTAARTPTDYERIIVPAEAAAATFYVAVERFNGGDARYALTLLRDAAHCPGACEAPERSDGAGQCIAADASCAQGFHEDGAGQCGPLDACADGIVLDANGDCRP
ncbi:MAG: hypothetical protein KC620_12535 [Myxococcales bacterium]|nr:hypothetical protein [Myxococcales bacterium]